MDVRAIINQVADEADELLASCTSPAEAKPEIVDYLKAHWPRLSGADQKAAVEGVLEILRREGFFERGPGTEGEDSETAEGEE